MITTAALVEWFDAMLPDVTVLVGPDLPDKPDRAAAVTRGPGGRSEMQALLERGTITIRMRGKATRSDQPELDLEQLRYEIEHAVMPREFGDHAIVSIWPSGPWYPLPGPDSGRRYEFIQVFNYMTSTDI